MRIGLLIGGIPPDRNGGAEGQILQLAEQLGARGHTVTLFARTYRPRARVGDRGAYLLVRRRTLDVGAIRLPLDVLLATRDLALWRDRVDVLVAYQTVANGFVGVLAGKLLHLPVVVSIRGNREYRESGPLPAFVYRHASGILVQSELVRQDLLGHLQRTGQERLASRIGPRIMVWPNGLQLPALADGIPGPGEGILFVGRLVRDKGVGDLIQAVARLPGARLTVVGDGPERPALETQAAALGGRVEFTGWIPQPEVLRRMSAARVLVLPSYKGDGLPNVVLEAMALGRPIVASAIAGIPELVRDGETGFLIRPGDVEALAAHLARLLSNAELAARLGLNARALAERFSWSNVVPALEELLLRILSPAQERRPGVDRVGHPSNAGSN